MADMREKALSVLSIAAKAGKVLSGAFMTENAIKNGTACLVIIAENASENTKKKFTDKCKYYKVPCILFSDSFILGRRIGKQDRVTVCVTDMGLANQILNKLDISRDMEV